MLANILTYMLWNYKNFVLTAPYKVITKFSDFYAYITGYKIYKNDYMLNTMLYQL